MNTGDQGFEDQERFHRREWRIQRLGWVVMAVFIFAALLGVFGDGPLSSVALRDASGSKLRFDRFIRRSAPTAVEIHAVLAANERELRVNLSQDSAETFSVESIAPQPTRTLLVSGEHSYFFATDSAAATIVFRLNPQKIGSHRTLIQIGRARAMEIHQLTYP